MTEKCVCGRELVKKFQLNKGKSINLCALCAHLITKQTVGSWDEKGRKDWFKNKGWEFPDDNIAYTVISETIDFVKDFPDASVDINLDLKEAEKK